MKIPEGKSSMLGELEKVEEKRGKFEICLVEEGKKRKREEQKMSIREEKGINVRGEQWFGSKLEREKERRWWKLRSRLS